MDIYEALEKLNGYLDGLIEWAGPEMTDEELEEIGEIENVIYQFARKHEPQKELPLEFTCSCGEHLIRHDIYADMSRFFCPKCKAEWLIGPQEV